VSDEADQHSDQVDEDRLPLLRLAVDQGVKSLEAQSSSLDSMHSRAGVLLGAAAAVTAFFGGVSVDVDGVGDFSFWLAVGLFALTAIVCMQVIQVRGDWQFTNSAATIAGYAGKYTEQKSLEVIAADLQRRYRAHEEQLQTMGRNLRLASIWLVLEVLSFVWLLSTNQ
jgi:hypothetical protein